MSTGVSSNNRLLKTEEVSLGEMGISQVREEESHGNRIHGEARGVNEVKRRPRYGPAGNRQYINQIFRIL